MKDTWEPLALKVAAVMTAISLTVLIGGEILRLLGYLIVMNQNCISYP